MIVGHIGGSSAAYNIANSLRFRASASAILSRTPGSAGNRKTWTWSGWVKLGALSGSEQIFSAENGTANYTVLQWNAGVLEVHNGVSGIGASAFFTSAVYRDPSAWYHIALAVDTTQAAIADRAKLYVNGVLQSWGTNGSTAWDQNRDTWVSGANLHQFGKCTLFGGVYLDAYLAEVNFVNGQALTPSSFGTTDPVTGAWVAKKYTGTYGTNGFYLPFNDGSNLTNLCLDRSGNGNNWTATNVSLTAGATYDWMVDTPTNNYPVMNPLDMQSPQNLDANLTLNGNSGVAQRQSTRSTFAMPSSGKFYWEATVNTATGTYSCDIGFMRQQPDQITGNARRSYASDGQKFVDGASSAYGASYTAGDVIGVAWDNGTATFYKNNVSQGSLGISVADMVPAIASYGVTVYVNFGQRPFSYTPPTGFKALCTANLPAVSVPSPKSHFDALTWTGNGAARSFTGYKFQPDLVWAKSRSNAYNHHLADAVRGATKYLIANDTAAEATNVQSLTSFNADGFSVGSLPEWNDNLATFVGWMWKAGGASVTNNAGSISSQVSANTQAGFSITAYTGTGVAGTIGHGLGVAPKLILVKDRDNIRNWFALHNDGSTLRQLEGLNTQAASSTPPPAFNNSNPTSTTFPVAGVTGTNGSTVKHIAYCFSEVPGFSKFGSYVGNGSTDGPFVYCGFRPRWVLIKCSSNAGTNWQIIDTARNTSNVSGARLRPNESAAEVSPDTSRQIDILANGFKVRHYDAGTGDGNISGYTYIYAAFAESPFGGAGIAPANAR